MKLYCLIAAGLGMLLGSAVPPPPPALSAPVLPPAPRPAPESIEPAPPVRPEQINWGELAEVAAPRAADRSSAIARPSAAAGSAGQVQVIVSLSQQKVYAFRGGALVFTSPASTGKRGHETPVGTFRITQKKVKHRSNLYDASMPYMQRLGTTAIALHAGHAPGYRASHGCIRMPWNKARKLYELTRHGTVVTVTRDAIEPA